MVTKKILNEEYHPFLEDIARFDENKITPSALFESIFAKYLLNLKDIVNQAELARLEDNKFLSAHQTGGIYKAGAAMNFFRENQIAPTYEKFLKAKNLCRYWGIQYNKMFEAELREQKEKMQALKDRVVPYREVIEKHYNTLFHYCWMLALLDRLS